MLGFLGFERELSFIISKYIKVVVVVVVVKAVWAYLIIQMGLYLQVNTLLVIYKSRYYSINTLFNQAGRFFYILLCMFHPTNSASSFLCVHSNIFFFDCSPRQRLIVAILISILGRLGSGLFTVLWCFLRLWGLGTSFFFDFYEGFVESCFPCRNNLLCFDLKRAPCHQVRYRYQPWTYECTS